MKKKQWYNNKQKGFTLVELMVALTLFVVVVMAAVSSLFSVNNASRKVQAMRSVLDNLNFAMESMSRTIRTGNLVVCGGTQNGGYPGAGSTYNCAFGVDEPGEQILVSSTLGSDQLIEYRWGTNPDNGHGQIEKRTQDSNGNWPDDWLSLTAPEIDVQRLDFYVEGADEGDDIQPSIIMFVQGMAAADDDNISPFSIQTYISQRAIE
jgi:prepilin-type N-terminal cleavage/methylation domain-containing protein